MSVGSAVTLRNHRIEVKVDENIEPSVKQTFRLELDPGNYIRRYNATETEVFEKLASEATDNVSKWEDFDERIKPSMDQPGNISISTSVMHRSHNVILEYDYPNLVDLIGERGRVRRYRVNVDRFNFYQDDAGLIIPDNTNMWINLPDSIDEEAVDVSPEPVSRFRGNEFHWNTGTWDITLEFEETEPISSWTIEGMAKSFRETFIDSPVYGAVLLILIILAFIYREHIKLLFSEGMASEAEAEKPKKRI